jgi:mannosyltransferase OCH1-like enzyme
MPNADQLIPRVIHRIWLGPDPVPDIFEQYAESWRHHHPDWEMRLWRDDNLPPLSCQAAYDRAKSFKSRYDITRLEVLRQLGGVVIDLDVEALRPIDPLLGGVSAFVGKATMARRMGNQVLGAVPNHPLWERAIRELDKTAGVASSASQEAGPAFVSRMVQEHPEQVTIFPRDYFFSPLTIEPPQRPEDFPEIYAVHHSTESYRDGAEGEIVRLTRRLRDSQREILRLSNELGQGPSVPVDARDAQRKLKLVTASRWWRLGVRLGICRIDG